MEIIVHIPEADKLARSIALLAAALGDKSAAALAREQKWNQGTTELQHPDEDPRPINQQYANQDIGMPIPPQAPQAQLAPVQAQQVAPVQPLPTAVPTAAPGQPAPIQQPQQMAPVAQPQAQPLPTTTKTYDLNDLAKAAGQLMDSGKQNELINLLNNQFKVQSLNVLPVVQYGAFAHALRGLGAQL